MSLWKSVDTAANAPLYSVASGYGISANGSTLYGNTQISAFETNAGLGVFGVDATEQGVAGNAGNKGSHAGWILRKTGTGPVLSISTGSGNKSNVGNAWIEFSGGGTGNTTANARIFVNTVSNVVESVTVYTGGSYSSTPTATVTGNANCTFTLTMGGRANRVQSETLVAMGSMTGDGSDDAIFADS